MLQQVACMCYENLLVRHRVLPFVAVCCSVLQCVAVCCRVLQNVAGHCRVLQGVAGCCRVLQQIGCICYFENLLVYYVLLYVAEC